MQSRPPLALLALSVMALAMDSPHSDETPEQKKAREERNRLAEEREAQRRAERSEQYQREQDAIAAPFREARRLRNLRKLAQGHHSKTS